MPPKNASTSVTPRERSEAPARAPGASPESYAATGPDVISAPPSQAHQRGELLAREHARCWCFGGGGRRPNARVGTGEPAVSSLVTGTSPRRSGAKSSRIGAMILHGPHQSA